LSSRNGRRGFSASWADDVAVRFHREGRIVHALSFLRARAEKRYLVGAGQVERVLRLFLDGLKV
jgi:hypothetical protein